MQQLDFFMSEQKPHSESEKLELLPSLAEVFLPSKGENEQLVKQDQERCREEFDAVVG